MQFKKMNESGDREQERFLKIKVYARGKTPNSLMGNKYRAMCAKRSILATYEDVEFNVGGAVVDLLADLRHLCDSVGLDYADHDRVAYNHYASEIGGK